MCFEWRDVMKSSKIKNKKQDNLKNNNKMEYLKAKTCSHELKAKENKYVLRPFLPPPL